MNKTYLRSGNLLLSFRLVFIGNFTSRTFVCLDNASHGLFLTPKDMMNWHRWQENPRVDSFTAARIISEYETAVFKVRNKELTMAETKNFYFRIYIEELDDEIVWVEPKDGMYSNSNPYCKGGFLMKNGQIITIWPFSKYWQFIKGSCFNYP